MKKLAAFMFLALSATVQAEVHHITCYSDEVEKHDVFQGYIETGKTPGTIKDGTLIIENALIMGRFTFENSRGYSVSVKDENVSKEIKKLCSSYNQTKFLQSLMPVGTISLGCKSWKLRSFNTSEELEKFESKSHRCLVLIKDIPKDSVKTANDDSRF